MKRLADRLGPLCFFWDARVMMFEGSPWTVIDSFPGVTFSRYTVRDGSWWGQSILIDGDGDLIPGAPPPARFGTSPSNLDEAVAKIVYVQVEAYRQRAADPDPGPELLAVNPRFDQAYAMAVLGLRELT